MLRKLLGVVGVSSLLAVLPLTNAGAASPPPSPSVVSWTGCYVDGGVGYNVWNQDHSETSPGFATTVTTTDGGRGWLGRFGGGCDYQTPWFANRLVIGLLADYDLMSKGSGTNSPSLAVAGAPEAGNESQQYAWYVGGRIGFLMTPSFFTYVDGGFTQTRFQQYPEFLTGNGLPDGFQWSDFSAPGWFIGGGTETSLASLIPELPSGLFLRTEYRYDTYASRDINEFIVATGAPDGNVEHMKSFNQTVTTSLVWRFNWH